MTLSESDDLSLYFWDHSDGDLGSIGWAAVSHPAEPLQLLLAALTRVLRGDESATLTWEQSRGQQVWMITRETPHGIGRILVEGSGQHSGRELDDDPDHSLDGTLVDIEAPLADIGAAFASAAMRLRDGSPAAPAAAFWDDETSLEATLADLQSALTITR